MPRSSLIFFATLAVALALAPGAAYASLAAERVVVMTAEGAAPLATGSYASRADVSGIAEVDAACRASGVVAVEPYYPGNLRRPALAKLAARLRVLRLAEGVEATAVVARFAALPCLASAEVPAVPRLYYTPNDGYYPSQWTLPFIGAPAAWDIIRGDAARAGVVGVIDIGVNVDHPEFAPNLWINDAEDLNHNQRLDAADLDGLDQDQNGFVDDVCGWDFTDDDPRFEPGFGHGNGVAACVSAATDNGFLGAAIGFGVRLMTLQGITAGGSLADGYVPMLYAADNGANVVVCAWGIPIPRAYEQAIVTAVASEDVVIIAAGGEGNQVVYPAGYDGVMAVSATDDTDHRAPFGPWGAYIDICAPGVNILTIMDDEMRLVSGTSFAAGQVAGLAGLVRAAWPEATAAQTMALLADTAVDLDPLNPTYAGLLGAGRIDAAAAVGAAITAAPVPIVATSLSCRPNPFNATTVVRFDLTREAAVDLAVFDLRGRRVAVLAQAALEAGPHDVTWDAAGLPSGPYLVRLAAGAQTEAARLSLVK